MAHPAIAARGAVVLYHGSIGHAVGRLYVVAHVDTHGHLDLLLRDQPDRWALFRVRQTSVTVTEGAADLCTCDHEIKAVTVPHRPEACQYCPCRTHTRAHQPPPGHAYVIAVPVPPVGLNLYRYECLSCGATDDGICRGRFDAVARGTLLHPACTVTAAIP